MADFETAYNNTVVKHEGGYRNFSWDAETYRGINRRAHPTWQGWAVLDQRKPIAYNKVFTDLEPMVKSFYLANFWQRMYGAYINNQTVANLVFDYFVQTGPYAIKKVQRAINTFATPQLADDGIMGNDTVGAINTYPAYKVNNAILEARKAHYQSLLEGGTISMADWGGILNRLASFPYIKETIISGTLLAVCIAGFLIYNSYK